MVANTVDVGAAAGRSPFYCAPSSVFAKADLSWGLPSNEEGGPTGVAREQQSVWAPWSYELAAGDTIAPPRTRGKNALCGHRHHG